jgi:uncharacterized membrane protein YhaH (DUF805 family)
MDIATIARIAFSFTGRMGRIPFWIAMIGLALASGIETRLPGLVGALLAFAMLWVFWASLAKRAHDRGKSVWSVVLAALPFMISAFWYVIIPAFMGAAMLGLPGAAIMAGIGGLIFGVWALIGGLWLLWELGIQEGDPQANVYGPPPRDLIAGS